ncbi:MAG: AAA family ATPase [Akkermansia sp.]
MNIEKIIFSNLNSLCGTFSVDFTHPSLDNAGIFVITGNTGVGKTTILDAICLALYRSTPRLGRISDKGNQIMTRGCNACFAELYFGHKGRHYKVRTSQTRRRSGSDSPFAPPRQELSERSASGDWRLLLNGLNDISAFCENTLKLSFDNFCRCILLAQGDFSAFLRAKAAERSAVLENLTGTQIYGALGAKVQERRSACEKELASYQLREVMAPEARAELEQHLDAAKRELDRLGAQQAQRRERLALLQQIREKQRAREQARQQHQAALDAQEQFRRKEGQRLLLLQAQAAAQPAVVRCAEKRQQHRDHRSKRESKEQRLAELDARWRTQSEETLQAQAERIRAELVPLEKELAVLTARGDSDRAALTQAMAAQQKHEDELRGVQAELQRLMQQQAELRKLLEHSSGGSSLRAALSGLHTALKNWQQHPLSAQALPDAAELRLRGGQLQARQLELANGKSLEAHRQREQALRQAQDALRSYRKEQEREDACRQAVEQARNKAESLPALSQAEQKAEACRHAYETYSEIARAEEHLAALYRRLQHGELDCCPLCGHAGQPLREYRHAAEDRLAQLKQAWESAAQELRTLTRKHQAADTALQLAQQAHAGAVQAREEAQQAWALQRAALGLDEDAEHLTALITEQATRCRQLQELQAKLELLQQEQDCRQAQDGFLEQLVPHRAEQPATPAEAAELLRTLEQACAQHQAWEQRLQQGTQALTAQQAKELALTTQLQEARQALQGATERLQHTEVLAADKQGLLRDRWGGLSSQQELPRLAELQAALREHRELSVEEDKALQARSAAEQAMQQTLREVGLADEEAYRAIQPGEHEAEQLQQRSEELQKQCVRTEEAEQHLRRELDALCARSDGSADEEKLLTELSAGEELQKTKQAELKALEHQQLIDDTNLTANRETERSRAPLEQQLRRLALLSEVLGRTKDGFRSYAQQITFGILIRHANAQLRSISERYQLMAQPESLELRVRDEYLDEEGGRDCSNLSGGESFIVSLALALGLSQMVGEVSFDTLFLDEGFGTLDAQALEQVLSCLERLHERGKLIGIISHVDRLRERLLQHIDVIPGDTPGLSTINKHPAVTAEPAPVSNPESAEKELQRRILALVRQQPGARRQDIVGQLHSEKGLSARLKKLCEAGLLRLENRAYYPAEER